MKYCHVTAQTNQYLGEQSKGERQRELEDEKIQEMLDDDFDDCLEKADMLPDALELFRATINVCYKKEDFEKFEAELFEKLRPIAAKELGY